MWPGWRAPAIRRSRVAGSKSWGRSRRSARCSDPPSRAGQAEGGGAGGLGPGQLRRLGVEGAHHGHQAIERLARDVVLEPAAEDAGPERRRRRAERVQDRLGRTVRAGGIERIGTLQGVVGQGQVGHRAREGAGMVEAVDEGIDALARQPAEGGLEAEHAAQGRRHADRAVGVRPQGERDQPRRHRRRRTAGGAAGDAGGIVGIAGRAVVAVLGGEAVGVLVHVERPDHDRAGGFEAGDQGGVGGRGRIVLLDDRARQGHLALHVVEVLDRHRDAGQRTRIAALAHRFVDLARGRQGAGREHGGEAVEGLVGQADAAEHGLGHLQGAEPSAAHFLGDLQGREVSQGGHSRSTVAGSRPSGRSRSANWA